MSKSPGADGSTRQIRHRAEDWEIETMATDKTGPIKTSADLIREAMDLDRDSLIDLPQGFPAKNRIVRRDLVRRNICPECGGELDTGWECNACQFDAMPEAPRT